MSDLPGLAAAVATGSPILACYILDDDSPGDWQMGAASRWWLHHSLAALSNDIEALGGELYCARGRPEKILRELADCTGARQVFCSSHYEPWSAVSEECVQMSLQAIDVNLECHAGSLLWEPEQVMTRSGTPFKVFTPFWKACRALMEPPRPFGMAALRFWEGKALSGVSLGELKLITTSQDWTQSWPERWQPGEKGAEVRLREFLAESITRYGKGRDFPAVKATSLLSPHLHFGEIAPNRVYHSVREAVLLKPALDLEAEKFLSELGWREFSRHLLFHYPQLPEKPFKSSFINFQWAGTPETLKAWKDGQTGYPIVDAGMRELQQTGYMHNRVRMVAASFLCKHLLIDWRVGERWFWDSLVDADLASNASGWQWVAGSGADASPYFRIFNPTLQGEKFDKEGLYVRRWVPELSGLPDRYLYKPWAAPHSVLEESGITLGDDYPLPIVDHKIARETALDAYAQIKSA